MIKIDEQKLHDYIKESMKDIENIPTEDIVLMIMGSYHLETMNDCNFSVNVAITGTSIIAMILASGPILIAGCITASIAGCIGLLKNNLKERKIDKLKDGLVRELMKRYPTFLDAYIDLSKMIEETETEDLLEFFKKADAYNE